MFLNDSIKKDVKKQFKDLKDHVRLVVFTQRVECDYCADTRKLASELVELSDKLHLEVYDFEADTVKVREYRIDKIPALAVAGEKKDYGIRFFGIPAGYEFTSLVESIKMVSTGETGLSEDMKEYLDGIRREAHIQVFVTPTCPYCPSAVVLAHGMALYSDKVRADMVEVTEFPFLGTRYSVSGVPRTVINENFFQDGAAPEHMLLTRLKEAQL